MGYVIFLEKPLSYDSDHLRYSVVKVVLSINNITFVFCMLSLFLP